MNQDSEPLSDYVISSAEEIAKRALRGERDPESFAVSHEQLLESGVADLETQERMKGLTAEADKLREHNSPDLDPEPNPLADHQILTNQSEVPEASLDEQIAAHKADQQSKAELIEEQKRNQETIEQLKRAAQIKKDLEIARSQRQQDRDLSL